MCGSYECYNFEKYECIECIFYFFKISLNKDKIFNVKELWLVFLFKSKSCLLNFVFESVKGVNRNFLKIVKWIWKINVF